MNLSLYKLRKQLKKDKSGQSSLVGVILASVIGTVIVGSLTQWYLSMNKTMSGTNDRLEAMTIAMSEWQRLEHMSLDELEANRENYKNPYDVGEKFKVGVTLGEQGFFDEGKCNSLTGTYAGENANCFKDTIMTVYDKDGNAMYTTRSLPLSVGGASIPIPEGTIWPYTGDLAKIPHGWVLCDGNNGTPDLRNRFIMGWGSKSVGSYVDAGLPQVTFSSNSDFYAPVGGYADSHSWGDWATYDAIDGNGVKEWSTNPNAADAGIWARTSGGGGQFVMWMNKFSRLLANSSAGGIYGKSNTVQPPAYVVYYIMKVS